MNTVIQPFPILKLPFIPLNNIIQNFNQLQILDFSFVSKKCRCVIKSMKLVNYDIALSLQFRRDLIKFAYNKVPTFRISSYILQKRNKYMNMEEDRCYNKMSRVCLKWAKIWMDYICDLFRAKLNFLCLNSNTSVVEISAVAEWMNSLQSEFWLCHIRRYHNNSDILNAFFENVTFPIRTLNFDLKLESKVKPINCFISGVEEVFASTEKSKTIVNWINIDQLLTSNCVRIIMIEACTLSENDLNRLIKGWINGSMAHLEFFTAAVKQVDADLLLHGIDFEKRDPNLTRVFESVYMKRQLQRKFEGGYDIRRQDGTVATIQQKRRLPGTVLLRFEMAVWSNVF